jgi:hypothetical protein
MGGGRKFVAKTYLHVNDIVVFKLMSDAFKRTLFRNTRSYEAVFLSGAMSIVVLRVFSYQLLMSI